MEQKDNIENNKEIIPETSETKTSAWLKREQLIFEYITDLEVKSLKREEIAKAVGITTRQLQNYTTPDFWNKCLKTRREKYAKFSVHVDHSLIKEATGGDVQAMKLFYEKFEGLEKKIKHELEIKDLRNASKEDLMKMAGLMDNEEK